MSNIKILIVEDELLIAESLSDSLKKAAYTVTDIVVSAEEALVSISSNRPDLVLLDIRIEGEHSGIWLGQQLKKELSIPFVFLTSHGDKKTVKNAVMAGPSGYLIKPIDKEGLYATIETALSNFSEGQHQSVSEPIEPNQAMFRIKDALFLKDEYRLVKVRFDELIYVKASGNYVEILSQQRKQVIKHSLKDVVQSLPEGQFMQVHRSYVVNIGLIDSIGYSNLQIGKHEIPLSKQKRDELIAQLQRLS